MVDKINNNYYILWESNSKKPVCARCGYVDHVANIGRFLQSCSLTPDLSFTLYELKLGSGGISYGDISDGFKDMLVSDVGGVLVSRRLKTILSSERTDKDAFEWIRVLIKGKTESRDYYIMRFTNSSDTLSRKDCVYSSSGVLIKPVFDIIKVEGYSVFNYGDGETMLPETIVVCEKLREKIVASDITSIDYEVAHINKTNRKKKSLSFIQKTNSSLAPNACIDKELTYESLANWIDLVLCQKIPDSIVAFNFNLYERPGNEWAIGLIGSDTFTPNEAEWACDEVFSTGDNCFCWREYNTWAEILSQIKRLLFCYLDDGEHSNVLKRGKAVGVGFVDGDIDIIWSHLAK